MEFYVFLFALAIGSVYFGQVLGLLIHCDNCKDFKGVKKYAFFVPIFSVLFFFLYLERCAKEKEWKKLFQYILLGDKSILIMCSIVEVLPELQREQQRAKVRNLQRKRKVSFADLAKSVLADAHHDCARYSLHYF